MSKRMCAGLLVVLALLALTAGCSGGGHMRVQNDGCGACGECGSGCGDGGGDGGDSREGCGDGGGAGAGAPGDSDSENPK